MRWLVVTLTLISLVSVAQADIDFGPPSLPGPVPNGTTFTDPVTGVMATFSWSGGVLEIVDLAPFDVLSFGQALSVFGGADFVNITLMAAPGFVITGVSFDVGDFGGDTDAVTVTTIDSLFDVRSETQLLDMLTIEGLFGFTYQNLSFTRNQGFAEGFPSLLIKGGSPGFPNSMFLDNFSFTVEDVNFFVGTDDPTSGLGGANPTGNSIGGPGGLPMTSGGTIPEPSSLALLAAGFAALALRRRKR